MEGSKIGIAAALAVWSLASTIPISAAAQAQWQFVPRADSNEDENALTCFATSPRVNGTTISVGRDFIGNYRIEFGGPSLRAMNTGVMAYDGVLRVRVYLGGAVYDFSGNAYWNTDMSAVTVQTSQNSEVLSRLKSGDNVEVSTEVESSFTTIFSLLGSSAAIAQAQLC